MTDQTDKYKFVCLDPKKQKRKNIEKTLLSSGPLTFLKLPPIGLKNFPETLERVDTAFSAATKIPKSKVLKSVKRLILRLQYNGSRRFFLSHPDHIAVAWNGLNGTRRVFMDGAKDAAAQTLFFELSPFKGRITVDPKGVNFANSLPRSAQPYLDWAAQSGVNDTEWHALRDQIAQRPPIHSVELEENPGRLEEKFIFIPLQVQGDSQLRLFGGQFKTVEKYVETIVDAAQKLPEGWHIRIKEHPSAPKFVRDILGVGNNKLILDNVTDTFSQVKQSQAVMTINSSVGMEAMFFDKPVVACGLCFWAFQGNAENAKTLEEISALFQNPEDIAFEQETRNAFLNYLHLVYYPQIDRIEPTMISHRLNKADEFGFWETQ